MPAKRVLSEDSIEEFKHDWLNLSTPESEEKYGVSARTLKRWAVEYNLPLPKPKLRRRIISANKITPAEVVNNQPKIDLDNATVQQVKELHECNEEFARINNDSSIPKREKDEMLCNLSLKIIGIYVSNAPNVNSFVERVVDFFKLKQYEKRINISEKDAQEVDAITMKALKRKHISECMDDICAELTDSEKKFFDHLLQVATDRVMERKTKINEAIQQRALEVSGEGRMSESTVVQ